MKRGYVRKVEMLLTAKCIPNVIPFFNVVEAETGNKNIQESVLKYIPDANYLSSTTFVTSLHCE